MYCNCTVYHGLSGEGIHARMVWCLGKVSGTGGAWAFCGIELGFCISIRAMEAGAREAFRERR